MAVYETVGDKNEQSNAIVISCPDFVRECVGRRRVFTPTTANRILVSGIENTGPARGPVFQLFDGNGNLLLSRIVFNMDFTDLQVFAATTNPITGEMTS